MAWTGYDWSRAAGEGNLSANELNELGLSASPEGALSGVDETKSQRGQEILDKTYQGNMGIAQPIEDEDKLGGNFGTEAESHHWKTGLDTSGVDLNLGKNIVGEG